MQPSTKKLKRIERKKKKLAALIEITELNNKDRNEMEAAHVVGPCGDHPLIEEENVLFHVNKKQKIDEVSSGRQDKCPTPLKATLNHQSDDSEIVDNCNSVMAGDGCNHRKKKKKAKLRHLEDHTKIGINSSGTSEMKEEWPALSPASRAHTSSQKRKSSFEVDVQKERPVKIVKRHSHQYHCNDSPNRREQQYNFAGELQMLKKDLERNKRKNEKRKKKEKNKELTEENKADASDLADQNSQLSEDLDEAELQEKKEEGDLAELKKLLKERKKQLKEIPMLRLRAPGKEADLEYPPPRTPILPLDVQNLILLSQLGHDCPRFPRWVELKKFNRVCKTVLLVVEGAAGYEFYSRESKCRTLKDMDVKVEMVSPYCYNANAVEELCAVPISRQQKKELERKYGKEICFDALQTDRIIKVLRSAFSISLVKKTKSEEVEKKITVPGTDKFPRTELLLSVWQLIEEGYPLPFGTTDIGDRYPDYVMTKEEYAEVTPSSPMWALDCEMCLTSVGNELTRISVVNEQHKTVYESFCMPRNPIRNYLTEFSGITPQMLKGVKIRLEDIQRDLRALFPPDLILVGQSLNSDLHALKMMHPYIIDTSVIFNLTGVRRRKSKLAHLSSEFLKEEIQQRGAEGHDSVEDSLAALKLVQLKLSKSLEYGDAVLAGMKVQNNPSLNNNSTEQKAREIETDDIKVEVGPTMNTSLFRHVTMKKKTVGIIGQEETLAEYSTFIAAAHRDSKQLVEQHTTNSNEETILMTCRQCRSNDFTLAHVVLDDEEDIVTVDSWMKRIFDSPPFNSIFIIVLVGSHNSFANGACLAKVKKPNMKLKPRKTD